MVSKPHRTNSDFQLRHFMAGSCHTADGAWALLYGQKIDIEVKIQHAEAQRLRREAAISGAQDILNSDAKPSEKMLANADIIEQSAGAEIWEWNTQAAINELATINGLMAELEPLRKHGHLPLLEANEASQREEWLLELQERAENFLLTQGTIPHDHLHTMRCHPDFKTIMAPAIGELMDKMRAVQSASESLALIVDSPKLLGETK